MTQRHPEPAWVEHVMWWHLYPLGFLGAPIRPDDDPTTRPVEHRLERLEPWLDHLIDLGLNGLALGPIFASSTHGYDTVEHHRIDPRLGDDADFDRLVAACRERGIRLLLDGVFNHVGRAHPAFRDVEADGPASASAELFRIDSDDRRPGDPVRADVFEGHESLVALDHTSPAVEDLVVDVMTTWLDRGADGWRLDAAYAVDPAFWGRVLPRVRERHPDAWFSGEVIHGDGAAIVATSTMDSLTQYELWQGIWHAIADRNLFELAHAIGRHDALLDTYVPTTFIGNHDVTRIATAIGPEFVPHALAVLFTVAGTPMLYAGDELAFEGVKEERLGGDDAVRPEFPPNAPADAELAPDARRVLDATRTLVALRRRHPWLHTARTEVEHLTNTSLALRTATDTDALVTVINLGDDELAIEGLRASTVGAGDARLDGATVAIAPRGWAVLR
ncbi:glycosidase [Pseudoclavibacter chungangensis]|nr:glycosidase [Pseudoclavibacter chungangensis]